MAQSKKTGNQIGDDTKRMAHMFDRVFSSPDGAEVLHHLQVIFKNQHLTRSSDQVKITIAAAQHDVILQIESMLNIAESDKKSMGLGKVGGTKQ